MYNFKKKMIMKQGTMNILFFVLKTKLLKNGEAPILMRITINGQYEEVRIQRSISLKNWNPAKGCSKGKDRASIELNNYIGALTTRAYEKHKEQTFESALITPKTILKRVFGKDETIRTLMGTIIEEISSMEKVVDIDYSPVTHIVSAACLNTISRMGTTTIFSRLFSLKI